MLKMMKRAVCVPVIMAAILAISFANILAETLAAETSDGSDAQFLLLSGPNGKPVETLVFTPDGEIKDATGQMESFRGRKLLVDLQPSQSGPPIFLTFLKNIEDDQGRVEKSFAVCQADRVVQTISGLSLGKSLWSTPDTVLIFQSPVYFGSYEFIPAKGSFLCFLLVKHKGAAYLCGQGKIRYKDKDLLNLDQKISIEDINSLLKSQYSEERLSAVLTIGLGVFDGMEQEDCSRLLVPSLQDENWNVRRAASFSLDTLGATKYLPILQERLKVEENEHVKAALEKAIASLQNRLAQEEKQQ